MENLPRKKDCPFLIPNPVTGKPWVSIKGAWATAIKEADLPGLRIHDLRHTAASLMINAGIDLYAVSKVLGHSDLASSKRYSHLAQETLFRAVEAGANKQAAWTAFSS
jgi:site-specific recombinase XerD